MGATYIRANEWKTTEQSYGTGGFPGTFHTSMNKCGRMVGTSSGNFWSLGKLWEKIHRKKTC